FRDEPAIGGRALAGLALLEEKKGTADSMKLAATYYRTLGNSYANVEVRKGKTGGDLFNDLAADKRFLPYPEASAATWGNVRMAGQKKNVGYSGGAQFVLMPEGELTPFARQHRLVFDPNQPVNTPVRLIDAATGKERWAQNLGQMAGNNLAYNQL